MDRYKKIKTGYLLILFGLFIPLVSFPFASNYHPKAGLTYNIQKMKLVIQEEVAGTPKNTGYGTFIPIVQQEISIPYKYLFSIGIIFIFSGVGIVILSNIKKPQI